MSYSKQAATKKQNKSRKANIRKRMTAEEKAAAK